MKATAIKHTYTRCLLNTRRVAESNGFLFSIVRKVAKCSVNESGHRELLKSDSFVVHS